MIGGTCRDCFRDGRDARSSVQIYGGVCMIRYQISTWVGGCMNHQINLFVRDPVNIHVNGCERSDSG